MAAKLVVTAGPDKGRLLSLPSGQTAQLGRSQAVNLRLSDPAVSRVHCELEVTADQVVLHNISSQGTLVNGKEAAEQALRFGDVIKIGNSELRYLAEDANEPPTLAPSDPLAPEPLQNLAGRLLGHFAIDTVVAKGSSSYVFKATDTRTDRLVALKVLQPAIAKNDEDMQRFVRAMKTTMPLRHPNLVALLGAGKTGPYCWMAMEFVDGECLTQVIQRIGVAGMLDWKYGFRVAVHIARALEYAHGQAIIHRNVTPRNILLRSSDKFFLLGDLMLAKALEGTLAVHVTRPGELVGDLAYMSPERTQGMGEIDGRADLYGLGATVYAVLTGRPPFAGAPRDIIGLIRGAEPEKPSKYQMSIPGTFQGVVMKLLSKHPEERYPTAGELLQELERVGKFAGVTV